MSGADGGGGVQAVVAVIKEVWQVFLVPAGIAAFGFVKWFSGQKQTAEDKRAAAFSADMDRVSQRVNAHVDWQKEEIRLANARADRAEEAADALRDKARAEIDAMRAAHEATVQRLREERWRLELWVRDRMGDHGHDVNNLRLLVNDLEERLGLARRQWPPLERPKLPGDPA